MSVAAQKWAWEQNLPDRPKFVLVTMADQADSRTGHVCYQRTDAAFFVEKCNISERSFYRCVAALTRNGYLLRESGRGKGQETKYWLCLDRDVTPLSAWSWNADGLAEEALTQDVAESATVADQESEFESARLGSHDLPSVAEQDSFEVPKITKANGQARKSDFSKQAQNVERGTLPQEAGWYDRRSPEARALRVMCAVLSREYYFDNVMGGATSIRYPGEITAQLLALKDSPPRPDWVRLEGRQIAAWFEFARRIFPNARIALKPGARAPWPWPPRKSGQVHGPPDEAEEDSEYESELQDAG